MNLVQIVIVAFGGCLFIEGIAWAIFPTQMRHLYSEMLNLNDKILHQAGLASVAAGVIVMMMVLK